MVAILQFPLTDIRWGHIQNNWLWKIAFLATRCFPIAVNLESFFDSVM